MRVINVRASIAHYQNCSFAPDWMFLVPGAPELRPAMLPNADGLPKFE